MNNKCRSNVLLHSIGMFVVLVATVLLCVTTIIAPILVPNGAYADVRNGSSVNDKADYSVEHTIQQSNNRLNELILADADNTANPYVQYSSWEDIAQCIEQHLNQAMKLYSDKQIVNAQSEFSSTYNLIFVASNFVTASRQYLGADKQMAISQDFQQLQTLSFAPNHAEQIRQQIVNIIGMVHTAAKSLDINAQVPKPRQYAKNIAEKTAEERKKIEANTKKETVKDNRTWLQIAQSMNAILDHVVVLARSGNAKQAHDMVNEAYYKHYERFGFEKNVGNVIGDSRVSSVEGQFKEIKYEINQHEPIAKIRQSVMQLKRMLIQDAHTLDGGSAHDINPITKFITSSFGQSFIILIREGLEALLVVAAIIAYLLKSGNKHLVRWIYLGVVVGLIGSGLVALLFNLLFSGNGPQQENLEGIVALVAMVMLLYTSNWMLSKSDAETWKGYIQNKTEQAIAQVDNQKRISLAAVFSLAMLSFLAVFREGAETVLFYESIYSLTQDSQGMLVGAVSAAVILIIIFLLIRFTSVHIPLKPFFVVTSIVMAILVITFAGGGVHSLIEGDLLQGIYLHNFPSNEWLGLYPFVETIVAQIIAILLVVGTFGFGMYRNKRRKSTAHVSESSKEQ